jgi:ABC-type Fe3+ transport system substrate-binding protein
MTDVLVYAADSRADAARTVLRAACAAIGASVRLDVYGSGSLYQRLGPRHAPPPPDLVMWFGPFGARSASIDGLLQPYRPAQLAHGVVHDPDWKWTALEYSTIGVVGATQVSSWQDLASVPRLAVPDPERSEVGLTILLSSLDRARQANGDADVGWAWWQARARAGLALAEDDARALSLVDTGAATHALTLSASAAPLGGLAPIPHAIGLAASSKNVDAARRALDWLVSELATASVSGLSPWSASGLLQSAPALDIAWCHQQYTAARRRWAQSGFGPSTRG